MALWRSTLFLLTSLAVLKEATAEKCPGEPCNGYYVQTEPFQMNGNITSIELLCQPQARFEVHLVLVKGSGSEHTTLDGLYYSTTQWGIVWKEDKWEPFADDPIAYEANDFIMYYVKSGSSNAESCKLLSVSPNNSSGNCSDDCQEQIHAILTTADTGVSGSNTHNNGNSTSPSAGGDQTAAVAALATLLVITVVGCGAAWAVLGAATIRRRRWRWWWRSDKGVCMPYIVRTDRNEHTIDEDYIEPDGAQGPAATAQQQDAEYSIVQPRDRLNRQDNHTSLPEAQQGDENVYSVLEEEDPYRAPANSVNAIFNEMSSNKGTYRKIAHEDVDLHGALGQGEFGMVHKGWWSSPSGQKEAAFKCLHGKQEEGKRVRLLQEAFIMGQFKHPHVVQLHGVVNSKQAVMLVMELLPGGDLRNFLLNAAEKGGPCSLAPLQLLTFCQDVAAAMVYLSHKGFIHRDLAARNILLDKTTKCKIADFGMSRDLEEEYYYTPKGGRIPVKWTAPEAILFHKYTSKSDVWSYGMVMYEIWSLGHKPFEELSTQEVINVFNTGYCQPPPPGCPRGIYSTMVSCWNPDYHSRPSFKEVHSELTRDPETLLAWSGGEEGTPPQAVTLGAPLSEGGNLHRDLQTVHKQRPSN